MGMPNNLILIRHGESEGNIATNRSKQGDHSAYSDDFRNRHSSLWRLSDEGVKQAQVTGEWIRQNMNIKFDRFYSSEYLRAMETAANLKLENASWFTEFYLRERNWGNMDRISVQEREEKYSESLIERNIDPFYWTPPNGESIAELCLRIDRIIDTLHRECDGKNVVIVCHGEVMWAFRVRLERMSQETFHHLDSSKDPADRIHNCQILHYTRINPNVEDQTPTPYLGWMKSICPWRNEVDGKNKWNPIERSRYNNEELLKRVERIERIIE